MGNTESGLVQIHLINGICFVLTMVSGRTGVLQTFSPAPAVLGALLFLWDTLNLGGEARCASHRVSRTHLVSFHEDEQGALSKAELSPASSGALHR